MPHPHTRPFTRVDAAALALAVLLGAALAVATDREYMILHGRRPARASAFTRLPGWVKERRHDAIRVLHAAVAFLTGLGLGVAVVTARPRGGGFRRSRLGAGHVAALLTAVLALAFAVRGGLDLVITPPNPRAPARLAPPGVFSLYTAWYELRRQITWAILGAWLVLAATGRWRRPIDAADRLGRVLGLGWLVLLLWQGVVFVIAWY